MFIFFKYNIQYNVLQITLFVAYFELCDAIPWELIIKFLMIIDDIDQPKLSSELDIILTLNFAYFKVI